MTDLILLTGFLGSGKTTLMRRLLTDFGDQKIGVIVNEFGRVNIDAKLMKEEGIEMAELSNGSIFCACLKDSFANSLISMSSRGLDKLFIEASGLADPASMERLLQGIADKTGEGYNYLGSICIADSENYSEFSEILPAVKAQTEYAGAVIINKTDLADEDRIREIRDIIRTMNETAGIYPTSYCDVDVKKIVEELPDRSPGLAPKDSSNTWENRANTFLIVGSAPIREDDLKAFLDVISESSYRIKGFAVTDHGNKEISTVGRRVLISDWDEEIGRNEIVVISSIGFGLMSILTREIRARFGSSLMLEL